MKKIHRYITYNFLIILFFSIVFSLMLFYISDFFSNISSILQNSVSVFSVIKYYFYYTPFIIYWSMPIIFALASLISLGFLSMKNEIIVMRSSGINIFRIASPVILLSLLFSVLMFVSGELVVDNYINKAFFIKHFEFSNKTNGNFWTKNGNFYINASRLNIKEKTAYGIKLYKIKNSISESIYSDSMKMEKNDIILHNASVSNIQNPSDKKFYKTLKLNLSLDMDHFIKSPEGANLSLGELFKNIKTHPENGYYYKSIISFKIFYPLSCFVLTLLSLVFVLKITPRKSGFIKNVFLGGVLFVVFVGFFEVINSMGKADMISPVLSIVVFMLFSIVVSMYNLFKMGI